MCSQRYLSRLWKFVLGCCVPISWALWAFCEFAEYFLTCHLLQLFWQIFALQALQIAQRSEAVDIGSVLLTVKEQESKVKQLEAEVKKLKTDLKATDVSAEVLQLRRELRNLQKQVESGNTLNGSATTSQWCKQMFCRNFHPQMSFTFVMVRIPLCLYYKPPGGGVAYERVNPLRKLHIIGWEKVQLDVHHHEGIRKHISFGRSLSPTIHSGPDCFWKIGKSSVRMFVDIFEHNIFYVSTFTVGCWVGVIAQGILWYDESDW